MVVEEHAPIQEQHREKAREALDLGSLVMVPRRSEMIDRVAQALADEYKRGQDDTWEAADKAIRGMQPGPAKGETSFERFSANSKAILDATRELHYGRHPEARPR